MQFTGVKILLIEDSYADADLLEEQLFQVKNSIAISLKHVERLKQGIDCLKQQHFDVVLADLSLPDAQGLDTVMQIHAINPDLPIVVMTSLDDEAVAVEAVRQGAQDYLVKGQISHHLLLRAIRYAIERLQTQKLLRDSLEKFRSLVETTSDCVWEMNAEYIYTYVSPRIRDILGYAPEEVVGRSFFDLMPSTEAERVKVIWQAIAIDHQPFQGLEYVSVHKHNHIVDIETNGIPFFSSDRGFCGYRGVDRDITARKQSESLLRESEQRLQAILDNTTAVIYIKDLQERFVLVNRQYEKLFKVKNHEIQNFTCSDVFPPEAADVLSANHEAVLKSLKPITIEENVLHEDGLHTYVSVKFPLFDENNQPYAICGISTDITERRQAEEETQRALEKERELSELRSEFVSMVSHEFRTPLSSIMLSADLLKNRSLEWPEEKTQVRFQRIKQSVRRMTELLEDVLTVSKADAGKLEFNPTLIDVESFCWEILEELQHSSSDRHTFKFTSFCSIGSCGDRHLKPNVSILGHGELNSSSLLEANMASSSTLSSATEHIPQVYLDERLLRHILTNLLSNAVKYSPEGGLVSLDLIYTLASEYSYPISVSEVDCDNLHNFKEYVLVLKVQDQGIGILPEDRNRLFESFHRGKNISNISGTGLGLVIVKKSVDIHGGKILMESEVDVGTTFTVILPV